jgi:hypothetical protein
MNQLQLRDVMIILSRRLVEPLSRVRKFYKFKIRDAAPQFVLSPPTGGGPLPRGHI